MAGRIPDDFVKDLIQRVDIVHLIESRIPLIKAGKEYKACCPFHEEKTPSFYVNPDRQFFHCFGCGEGGSAVSFLMKYANLSFLDAIEELASIAGVKIPVQAGQSFQKGKFDKLLDNMQKASSAYTYELMKGRDAQAPQAYLKSRNVTVETARKFGLGYAPGQWDYLLQRLGKTQEDRKLLMENGLVISKDNGRAYDRFRDRLMFPILDRRGRAIAFGGRILNTGEPKYLNSPETPLFKKGNEMFGLYQAMSSIRKKAKVLIVEGYTDVLALSQHGIDYSVATLGTATTQIHARVLFHLAPEIVFCFDGDNAGRIAAWRALEAVLPLMYDGYQVSFVFLPQGHDPDSLVQEEGLEGFETRIAEAEPIENFIFDKLRASTNFGSLAGKAKFIQDFSKIFAKLPDSAFRELVVDEVSRLTGMDKQQLASRLTHMENPESGPKKALPQANTGPVTINKQAIALLVQNPSFATAIEDREWLAQSEDRYVRLIAKILDTLESNPGISTSAALLEEFRHSEELFKVLTVFAGFDHRIPEDDDLEKSFCGVISKINELVRKQKVKDLTNQETLTYEQEEQLMNLLEKNKELSSTAIH